jgi:hypothetical protein
MSDERVPSEYERTRRVSAAAIEGLDELRRATEGWLMRTEDPAPAEVHEVVRGLAVTATAAGHACEAVAAQWLRADTPEGAVEAQLAAEALRTAVHHLTRLGVVGAETHLETEAWADPAEVTE